MNADSTFQIGKEHKTCEDYALAGVKGDFAYAIVCDGCSASPDVDSGARFLALSARESALVSSADKLVPCFEKMPAITNAFEVVKRFPEVRVEALDATLLVALVKQHPFEKKYNVLVEMFGDGVMVHTKVDGTVAVHVQLTSGAPDYLSYNLDDKRREAYDGLPDNKKEIVIWDLAPNSDAFRTYAPFDPFIYQTEMAPGDVISVISDGINSFRKSNSDMIDWKALVPEFTGFKNFEGQFVQRRIGAFKRKFTKENWQHLDDISIASIYV